MSSPYIGEIRIFAGNFAPLGWAFCNGTLIPISENDTLYSLIGTTYGGDGQETFALPDLRGRFPVHQGTLSSNGQNFVMGETGGTETVALNINQIPAHNHAPVAQTGAATQSSPAGNLWATSALAQFSASTPGNDMDGGALQYIGDSQAHDNMAPFLCVNFIIALYGVYPSQ